MKSFLIATAILICSVGATYAQNIDGAVEKYTAAVEKMKAGEFANALPLLKEAMNLGVDAGETGIDLVKEVQGLIPMAYLQLGAQEFKKTKYKEAVAALLAAEETADLYNNVTIRRQASRAISGVYQAKGIEAFNAKDYATALESFSKGYEQDPTNIKLAAFTAKSYAELGQLDKAAPIFQTVIDAGTSNSKYAEDATEAKADLSNYVLVAMSAASGEKNLDKVIELAQLAPQSPEAALMVIQTANLLKKFDVLTARAAEAAALQTDAAIASDIYYMAGTAYAAQENKAKAIEVLAKVTSGGNVAAAKSLSTELKK